MLAHLLPMHKEPKNQERIRNYNPIANFYFQKNETSLSTSSRGSAKTCDGRVDAMMNSAAISQSKIRCVMKVMSAHLYLFCLNINSLHVSRQPDSVDFSGVKNKMSIYYTPSCQFLIAYSIILDKCLNYHLQVEQLDLFVWFWNNEFMQVETCFFALSL